MNEPKHTPGPWRTAAAEFSDPLTIIVGSGNDARRIADTYDDPEWEGAAKTNGEALANAILIAHAPEMLSALEALASDRHIHEAGPRDACARCGNDIRHSLHYAAGESRKTDLKRARDLIARVGQR